MYRKLFPGALALAVLFLLDARSAVAVPPSLVKDLDPAPIHVGPEPEIFASLDNGINLFEAADGQTGRALWRTDGTAAGTYRLPDICPTSCGSWSSQFAPAGNRYFGVTSNPRGDGHLLWVTGGSADNTFVLAEGLRVAVGERHVWLADQGLLYFVASDAEHGAQVWRSDGTVEGTRRATEIALGAEPSAPSELTAFKGEIFFQMNDGVRGPVLWATDGTPAGTRMVRDPWPGRITTPGPSGLRVANSRLLFFALGRRVGHELWASDGTPRGTQPITNLAPGLHGAEVFGSVVALDRYFFIANAGRGEELWVSDGTRGGTRLLTDLAPPQAFAMGDLYLEGWVVGGKMVFEVNDGVHGVEPWITDGTRAGTRMLRDICPGACSSSLTIHLAYGGRLYGSANDGAQGHELWSTDGTSAGTRLVRDLCRGACSGLPNYFNVVGGRLLFTASGPTAAARTQIWRTNGTTRGTVRVTAFERGLPSLEVGAFPGGILFTAWDREHGDQIWRSDGTRAGTRRVTDLHPNVPSNVP